MFKLFKKQKRDEEKKDQAKDGDCPMCQVSPEIINQLKEDKNLEPKHKSCCG